MTELFNNGWQFAKNGGEWIPVTLPHDWLIYDTGNLYESAVVRYRKTLIKPELSGKFGGRRVFLRFDGVYMDWKLIINGAEVGEWKYGYTAKGFDITDFLFDGDNEVVVEINHQSPNSRWYSGSGIFRDVTLEVKEAARFVADGIYVVPEDNGDGTWTANNSCEVDVPHGLDFQVVNTVEGEDGIVIHNPKLWDIDAPNLYHLRSELFVNGELSDVVRTRFGLRSFSFDPDGGFTLNGRRVKIHGVCLHHDLGALGAAFDKDALSRQFAVMRGMGVNAVRTSHNPPAKGFMELADETGMLVMSELADVWESRKTEHDYANYFNDWVERDTASWIRRDRNSPSVILWSIGNEIHDTQADAKRGTELVETLTKFVKSHDPKGLAPVTFSSNYLAWDNTNAAVEGGGMTVVGYNYAELLYEWHHDKYPHRVIYGGETASHVQSRGVYRFPLSKSVLADDDEQCSALGNCTTSWGARSVEKCITDDRDADFTAGMFIWTGIDYIGEPTPYSTKNSYFGQTDTACFQKDTYYVYKAAWTDAPMIHLFPYWDFNDGQIIDVRAATNCHSAELFVNGKSLGKKERGTGYIIDWQTPYERGTIAVKAYDENGGVIACDERKSFGEVAELRTETETYGGLTFVTITAADSRGNIVENANRRVNVTVTGGELLGMDNGDSTDYDQYKFPGNKGDRRLFNGKLLVITRGTAHSVTVSAELDGNDIPIRKVELKRDGNTVHAAILPENATHRDMEWRLTDASGIDSPLANIAVDGLTATITPKGDGRVCVRAMPRNGKKRPDFISMLSMDIDGMGTPFTDPYTFVAGGLYTASNEPLTNGNERGVATGYVGVAHVGFENVDFGAWGSDRFTTWLFPLSNEPFTFEIWEGMPDGGGTKVADLIYNKGSHWNKYIEVSYDLPRKFKGVTTVCLVFKDTKTHIKGFVFGKKEKGFDKLYFGESDGISGDSYKVVGKAAEGIGNNVSVSFVGLDFGENGAEAVEIRYRSAIAKNNINLLFDGDGGVTRTMVEVGRQGEYGSVTLPLTAGLKGKGDLSVVFLPGSDIDVEYIRFIDNKGEQSC